MRAVFLGGGALSVMADRVLLNRAHEVIIIEQDKDRIDVLSDEFACGFIHGDGSKPAILRETDPRDVDFLFCLTKQRSDQYYRQPGGVLAGLERRHRARPVLDHLSLSEWQIQNS
jgi:hypothetical protein